MALNDYFESMDQIAATLAHEVKNPISIVRANIDYLELVDSDKRHCKNYRVMREELEHVFELLQDFISFNTLSDKSISSSSLIQILDEAMSGFECKSGRCNISFERPNEDIFFACDRDKLRRAFVNFIKNAVEAVEAANREQGEIKISIRTESGKIITQISDNGVGMSEEEKAKLNTVFFTTKAKGSGLGFLIAAANVREHSGEVLVESNKDKGTNVTVILPSEK